jgi:hypothetical protein
VGIFVLVITLLGVFGIVGSILRLKKSGANQMAVEALKKNPAAHEALGDIEKIGWPIGSISAGKRLRQCLILHVGKWEQGPRKVLCDP